MSKSNTISDCPALIVFKTHKTACVIVIQSCLKVEQLNKLSSLTTDVSLLSLYPCYTSHLPSLTSHNLTSPPGLLEDERLASAHQAEAFTHQIQNLQGKENNTFSPNKRKSF